MPRGEGPTSPEVVQEAAKEQNRQRFKDAFAYLDDHIAKWKRMDDTERWPGGEEQPMSDTVRDGVKFARIEVRNAEEARSKLENGDVTHAAGLLLEQLRSNINLVYCPEVFTMSDVEEERKRIHDELKLLDELLKKAEAA